MKLPVLLPALCHPNRRLLWVKSRRLDGPRGCPLSAMSRHARDRPAEDVPGTVNLRGGERIHIPQRLVAFRAQASVLFFTPIPGHQGIDV